MIVNFQHRALKRLFEKGDESGFNPDHLDKINNILTLLNTAGDAKALNLPGLRLHKLTGNLKGFWSVTVRTNWRIIFRFEAGNVHDVDFVDYH